MGIGVYIGGIIIKFTVKPIENTRYKTIDLEEHFKGIGDYPEDGESLLEYYNFQLLFKEEKRILFAVRNNYRADIYILNLDIFECESFGSLGTMSILEGNSLSLRGINMEKIAFEYEINDERNINGIYSLSEKEKTDQFQTSSEYEYLYLTDRYYLVLKDSTYYDGEKEEWIFGFEEDKLYLYDKDEDKRYEIFDSRLKNSYHTSSNHFIYNYKDENYFLNFPFMMDPEDGEELLKSTEIDEVLNAPKEISFILLDKFVENVKFNKSIEFEALYSWDLESIIKPYFHVDYGLKSLEFSIYDLKNKIINVFNPKLYDGNPVVELIASANYSIVETCRNVHYLGKGTIIAYRDNKTEILTPIRKTIKHSNRESVSDFNEYGYLIDGWSEDEDGSNYRSYIIIKDIDDNEIARLDSYFLILEDSEILIKI